MRAVIQRVKEASVNVDGKEVASINSGLLILLGIEEADDKNDIDWLVRKISGMRIFVDEQGNMNLSVIDVGGELLVVSQFTLHASTKKGNRPSFIKAAKPEKATSLYQDFIKAADETLSQKVKCGIFGADMKVSLLNDGPVTIIIDSKNKE